MEILISLFLYLAVLAVPSLALARLKRTSAWMRPFAKSAKRFPGPMQLPLIGRVHDLPKNSLWLKFKEWADTYGPIYETSMMGQKFIIISDVDMASELLIKHGNSFGGRPQIRALIDHKIGPVYEALQDRHETWKMQRKWVHAAMAAGHREHFHGHIEQEVRRWLMSLLLDPAEFHANTRELTGRIIARLSWDDAPLGRRNGHEALTTLKQMSVSGPLVNTVTPLWHIAEFFRFNPWRKHEEKREANLRTWWLNNMRGAKTKFIRGDLAKDTWAYRYFDQLQREGNATLEQTYEEEDFASCMLGFQCIVGVVTLSGPLQYFLMAMAMHPEWLKKAQEEIDRVCGDRMPCQGDFEKLPTVRACIKETLRWRSGVPLGVPHQCEKDHEYQGVQIKKGTVIMACEWTINRVKSKYPDPDNYHPERWLEPGWPTYMAPLTRYPNLREGNGMHTFGWGRRTCLGQTLADDELFVAAAAVCWGFDMGPKRCPVTGDEIQFDSFATNANVILEPTPWPMDFRPRSKERADLIMSEYATVRDKLRV